MVRPPKPSAGTPHSMTGGEWGLLVLLATIWGGSFFFTEVALAGLPPLTIVLLRVGLGAATLAAVIWAAGIRIPRDRRLWGQLMVMGAFNNALPFSLIVLGQMWIPGGLAAIVNATTPVWGVLIAHVATSDERLSWNRLLGVLAGVLGVGILVGPEVLVWNWEQLAGQLLVLGATLCYAATSVYGRRFRGLPALVPAVGQLTFATMLMVPIALLVERPWTLPAPPLEVWGAVLGLAVICTGVAYTIYFRILATAGATNIMLVTLLVPVSAILLGVGILGEAIGLRHLAGFAVIALALAAIDGRIWRRLRGGRRDRERPALR